VRPVRAGRVGIFGGTFDPIHCGHLVCVEQLRDALNLDRVVLVPCSRSPHKPRCRPAAPHHRLAMARLAARGSDRLEVSDLEIRRGGVSYMVDTIREFKARLSAGEELWLLLGADAFLDLAAWKDPQAVIRECFFGVAWRPGCRRVRVPRTTRQKTRIVEITQVDLSSTDVRKRLAEGKSIRFLVPGPVEAYIRRHHLYRRPSAPGRRGCLGGSHGRREAVSSGGRRAGVAVVGPR
jgi:nicotinate-nucleotide adenylyltransferase